MQDDIVDNPLPRPRQNRSKKKLTLILETAAQLFEEQGVANVTTNDIAAAAHVSVGSLYRYFPDKNAILIALVQHYIEQIETIFQSIENNPHLSEMTWQRVIYLLLETWAEHLDKTKANIYTRFYRNSPPFSDLVYWQRQDLWKKFAGIIRNKHGSLQSESELQPIAAACVVSVIAALDASQDMRRQHDETKRLLLLKECAKMVGCYLESSIDT